MLVTIMKIIFFNTNDCGQDGLSNSTIPLRPSFNFGNSLLFSGTIINNGSIEKYLYGEVYDVVIEFPTVEYEAYKAIEPLLETGMLLDIQLGSKIIGQTKLLDYIYQN